MTDFKSAFKKVIGYEGGYVNDPDDPGGETYAGIARKFNTTWEGWVKIDILKSSRNFEKKLEKLKYILDPLVENFYKRRYWTPANCDNMPQLIAEEVFEEAVNLGISKASTILQESLNLLNRNQEDYADLKLDGRTGQVTLNALAQCVNKRGDILLYKIMNSLQCEHYINLMRNNPRREKYIGWFKRVDFVK